MWARAADMVKLGRRGTYRLPVQLLCSQTDGQARATLDVGGRSEWW